MKRLIGRWVTNPEGEELQVIGFEGKDLLTAVLSTEDGEFSKVGVVDILRWEDENEQRGILQTLDRITCRECNTWMTAEHMLAWLDVVDLRAA